MRMECDPRTAGHSGRKPSIPCLQSTSLVILLIPVKLVGSQYILNTLPIHNLVFIFLNLIYINISVDLILLSLPRSILYYFEQCTNLTRQLGLYAGHYP